MRLFRVSQSFDAFSIVAEAAVQKKKQLMTFVSMIAVIMLAAIIIALLGVCVAAIPTGAVSVGFVEYYARVRDDADSRLEGDPLSLLGKQTEQKNMSADEYLLYLLQKERNK